jgi:hypothetical protein
MEPVTCKNAYFVKLGRKGVWEESSVKKSIIRIGWIHQTLDDMNNGRWGEIQKQLEYGAQNTGAGKGGATTDCRALRMLCESTNDDIWITFYRSHLWWCKVTDPGPDICEDKISKYRKVDGWRKVNICGDPLLMVDLPGRIAKVQRFSGTICRVREVDELARLINRQPSPEHTAIMHSKEELCCHVEDGLSRLHWKDFETLVDLLFRASGWRRVSVLGETMKFSDIELEDPITGDMYQVQVKAAATRRDLQEYTDTFAGGKYRRLFFVVHTPDEKLADTSQQEDSSVQLVLPKRLAEMVVELGLLNWLLNKIR